MRSINHACVLVLLFYTAVDLSARTFAASYYGSVLTQEPTKDAVVSVDSVGQDVRFTVSDFNKQIVGYALGMLEGLGLKRGSKVGLWMTGELEHATLRCAAGLLGIEVVVVDPEVGFAGVKSLIASEGLHALILSPRHGSEDRHGALRAEFAQELKVALEGTEGTYGYAPLESKRFRTLKHLVCTSLEHDDAVGPLRGVIRLVDMPIYGPCACPLHPPPHTHTHTHRSAGPPPGVWPHPPTCTQCIL